jgi:hypothetical protein
MPLFNPLLRSHIEIDLTIIQSMSEETPNPPPPSDPPPKEDFRQKQIRELEQLQITLDENNVIRQKFNALQTQVAPLVDSFAPAPVIQYQSERVYTPEEIEAMKQKLEQTLSDYREETFIAGRLNSEMEKRYTELSNMRMRFRLDQDERLTRQNLMAAAGLANFRVKSVKVSETTSFERERLAKAVGYLQHIFDSSTQDIREYETQNRANNRGIQELSASITVTFPGILASTLVTVTTPSVTSTVHWTAVNKLCLPISRQFLLPA